MSLKGIVGMGFQEGKARIVSCEVSDGRLELFIQNPDGSIRSEKLPYQDWLLSSTQHDSSWTPLQGNGTFKFIKFYRTRNHFWLDYRRYQLSACA